MGYLHGIEKSRRQERPHGADFTGRSATTSLTPAQFADLVAARLDQVCAGVAEWAVPVVVVGVVGDLPQARFGTLYRVPLLADDDTGGVAYLNVKEATLRQADVGPSDPVRVTGFLKTELFRGDVSIRLQVLAVEHDVAKAAPQRKAGSGALEALRRLTIDRRAFPATATPRIALIHSASPGARVADDFLGALEAVVAPNLVQRIPVSMHDASAVAGALRSAKADVVALVRGGGNPDEFAIFERPEILSELAACSGYRILGLGHSANRTLAELVADHSATTPAAAGEYIRRRIADGRTRLGLHGTIAELREALEQERRLRQAEAEAASIFEPVDRDVPLEVVTRRTLAARVTPLIWAAAVGGALAWAALQWL